MQLTKEEKAWVRKVNALLAKCPSDRLGFYTVGDHAVSIYDNTKDDAISGFMSINSNSDFGYATEQCGALAVQTITFPSNVHSTAG